MWVGAANETFLPLWEGISGEGRRSLRAGRGELMDISCLGDCDGSGTVSGPAAISIGRDAEGTRTSSG